MKKILVVDDEESIRLLVSTTLEDEEFEIVEASDGKEALERVKEGKPDLILLDVMMPEINGLEVCRRLKGDPETKDIYIIMLTAKGQELDKEKGKEVGADEYFTKPFSPLAMIEKVNEVLR